MDSFFKMFFVRLFSLGLVICFFNYSIDVCAQEVEHNYAVGPQNTDCDSLQMTGLPLDEIISTIQNTSFRFDQGFKITRVSGIREGHFYSCNGENGYLVLTIGKEKKVFREVPKSTWNEFINSSDLDGFYEELIKSKYIEIRD
jgi:hypothetical protein